MKLLRFFLIAIAVLAMAQPALGQGTMRIYYDDGRMDSIDLSHVTKVEYLPMGMGLNLNGLWKTTAGGDVIFQQNGTMVTGAYQPNEHGQIVGTLSGNVLDGYWIEDASAQRCSVPQYGRYNWGRVRFVFDGSAFQGQWSYCDAPLGQSWSGNRQ